MVVVHVVFLIAVIFSTIGYIIYLATNSSGRIKSCLSSENNSNIIHILFQRITGIFLFGIIPSIIVISVSGFEFFNMSVDKETLFWILVLSLLILPVNYINSKSPDNLAQYPQIRNDSWSAGLVALSTLSWIAYLFAYEMLFRNFLLFSSLELLGYWPSIILNIGIYSIVHYPKGKKEAFGAIPFGFILCILTIRTGSFMIAFIAHVVLALSNEWFSLYAMKLMNKDA